MLNHCEHDGAYIIYVGIQCPYCELENEFEAQNIEIEELKGKLQTAEENNEIPE